MFWKKKEMRDGKICPVVVMLIFLVLASASRSIAQNDSSNRTTPFDTGIILENSGLLIPWGLKAVNLAETGNPKIDTLARGDLNVLWDNLTICGGVKGSIKYNPRRKKHGDYTKLSHLYALVDNADFEKVVQYCNANIYTAPGPHVRHGGFPEYMWRTNKILIQITRGKYFTLMYIARDPAGIQ